MIYTWNLVPLRHVLFLARSFFIRYKIADLWCLVDGKWHFGCLVGSEFLGGRHEQEVVVVVLQVS